MRNPGSCILFLAVATFAQTANVPQAATQDSAAPNSKAVLNAHRVTAQAKVAKDVPVITIEGLCDEPARKPAVQENSAAAKPCRTVITRAEFDTLADALQPNMDLASKTKLADTYARILIMQREYRRLNLPKDPQVQRALAFARSRSEAEEAARAMKIKARAIAISDAQVEDYYKQRQSDFDQIQLQRIYIPGENSAAAERQRERDKTAAASGAQSEPAAASEPYKPQLDKLQARAAQGEDFEALQAQVFKDAGMPGAPPDTHIGSFAIDELPASLRSVLSLKAGEVSQVFPGPNGSYIYKLLDRSPRPLEQVRGEIKEKIADVIFAQSMQSLERSATVELNPIYFPQAGAENKAPAGKGSHGFRSNMPVQAPSRPVQSAPAPPSPASPGN